MDESNWNLLQEKALKQLSQIDPKAQPQKAPTTLRADEFLSLDAHCILRQTPEKPSAMKYLRTMVSTILKMRAKIRRAS